MWKLQYLSKDERLMLIIFLIDANQIAGGALLSTQEVCKECQNNKQNHLKKKKKRHFLFIYDHSYFFIL